MTGSVTGGLVVGAGGAQHQQQGRASSPSTGLQLPPQHRASSPTGLLQHRASLPMTTVPHRALAAAGPASAAAAAAGALYQNHGGAGAAGLPPVLSPTGTQLSAGSGSGAGGPAPRHPEGGPPGVVGAADAATATSTCSSFQLCSPRTLSRIAEQATAETSGTSATSVLTAGHTHPHPEHPLTVDRLVAKIAELCQSRALVKLEQMQRQLNKALQDAKDYRDMAHSLKGNIRVFCRLRPNSEVMSGLKCVSGTQLEVCAGGMGGRGTVGLFSTRKASVQLLAGGGEMLYIFARTSGARLRYITVPIKNPPLTLSQRRRVASPCSPRSSRRGRRGTRSRRAP